MVKEYNQRFSMQKYLGTKKKCNAFFNFLKSPESMKIQEQMNALHMS